MLPISDPGKARIHAVPGRSRAVRRGLSPRSGRSRRTALTCALAGILTACSGDSPTGVVAPPAAPPVPQPASLSVAAGDAQIGPPGAPLDQAPSVRVTDGEGAGVSGLVVTFTVVRGGGSVSRPTVSTDAEGRASAGVWTLGDEQGAQELRAAVQGVGSVVFRATARPGRAATLAILRGDGQTAVAGAPVAVRPAVTVLDSQSTPLAGVTVTFRVVGGAGSVTGGSAITDGSGAAEVGGWTLGSVTGANRLEAAVDGLPAISFEATAVAGAPAAISAVAGEGQTAPAGAQVPVRPAVRVVDAAGNPVSGVLVTFAVTAGGGHASGPTQSTGTDGRATVGGWTLGGAPGANALEATAAGSGIAANPVSFSATATSSGGSGGSGGGSGFDIEVRFNAGSSPTAAQRDAFEDAESRWEQVVTGDLPSVPVDRPAGTCTSSDPIAGTIDDLVIFVTLETIDGPGGVLGTAGPCMVRSGSKLPLAGMMRFDTADLAALEANGLLGEVVLHEMGHVLGVGTLWKTMGLLADPAAAGGLDPHFTGVAAIAAFDAIGGSGHGGQKVPVEDTGGSGTRDAHWRESVFDKEIMTGWIDPGSNPLSLVTIQSLADMGYDVDTGEAQSVGLTISPSVVPRGEPGPGAIQLTDDLWRGPIETVGPTGRPGPTIPG